MKIAQTTTITTILIGIIITTTSVAILSTIEIIPTNMVVATAGSNQTQNSEPVRIAAGGGSGTGPLTVFIPDKINIQAGQSVTWYNPTTVGEPHTVTFIRDNNTIAGIVSPLGVSNTTKFVALPPGSNNEPIIMPGEDGMNTIVAMNARTFNPVVIDSSNSVNFVTPNANYTMTGTEKYVNSGWFVPEGFEQEVPGAGNMLSMTFEKRSYHYICVLHPWMVGSIIVK